MKTLIFSDTHLTTKFDQKKFNFLTNLIKSVDKVIVNGDFWDSYFCSFNDFINSPWKQLFPLLREKKTIYCYGNHDRKEISNEKVELFSVEQCQSHEFFLDEKKYIVAHGCKEENKFFKELSGFFGQGEKSRLIRPLTRAAHRFEAFGDRLFGVIFCKLILRRIITHHDLYSYARKPENKHKRFIFSHTHRPSLKDNYVNTGYILFGVASYVIIEDEKVTLLKQKY